MAKSNNFVTSYPSAKMGQLEVLELMVHHTTMCCCRRPWRRRNKCDISFTEVRVWITRTTSRITIRRFRSPNTSTRILIKQQFHKNWGSLQSLMKNRNSAVSATQQPWLQITRRMLTSCKIKTSEHNQLHHARTKCRFSWTWWAEGTKWECQRRSPRFKALQAELMTMKMRRAK